MNGFSAFVTLQKVDVAKREVWGVAAVEQPDRAGEIMDYAMSKGNFVRWSQDMKKASGGKSQGNVRAMHADIAAGKVIHFEPNDEKKLFYIGTKIVDDNEWRKVLEGVYTGFSVGGSYGKKWADPSQFGLTRYEAKPVEISLVDVPCIPGAQFEVIKADGAKEMRKFVTIAGAADLAKGDEPGHPFRGNQYTDKNGGGGSGETKRKTAREQRHELFAEEDQDGKRVKVTDRATGEASIMTVREARKKIFDVDAQDDESPFDIGDADNEDFPDRVTEAAGTEADFKAREEEKKRRRQDDRVKRLKAANEKRAAAREKFVNSKPVPATGSAQEKAMGMTEAEFNALDEMGYVKPWGVSEEGMSELKSMRRDQSQANRFVEVDPGVKVPQKSAAPVHAPTVKKFPGWRKIEKDFSQEQGGMAQIAHDAWYAADKGQDATQAFIDAVENENFHGSRPDIVKDRKKVQLYLESKGIVFNAKKLKAYEEAQKAAGPGDLIKLLAEANMNADELIRKLQGSSDPAMMGLATQLSKAFPPPKKKAPGEGKDEPAPEGDGGDKPAAKGKGNPFAKEKDGAEEEAVPGEETAPGEEDDSEMESGDMPEDEIDPKTGEPVEQAGQMSPEQAEAVKMVVISLLEELGLVQRQESAPGTGGMQLSVSVTGLAKAMGVQGLSKRFETVLGDVGKLAAAVDDLEKRLGVMPVLREIGGSANPLIEQQAELLKGMLAGSHDPNIRQAIQNELATLEIKKIQSNQKDV